MHKCKICGNIKGNLILSVKEMMFGDRDEFEYLECAGCQCIQLLSMPDDFAKYYREGYYSFNKGNNSVLYQILKRKWIQNSLGEKNIIGKLVTKKFGIPDYIPWIKKVGLYFNNSILDYGCGDGLLLRNLYLGGFKDLTGADPYLAADMNINDNLNIYAKSIYEVDRKFDFIMLNHSFEHIEKPLELLTKLFELLNEGRFLLIRTPIVNSFAYRYYRENWVQIDAPRHIFVHSEKSIEILAKKTGFVITDIVYDSNAFQFYGSEQYKKNMELMNESSYWKNPSNSIFTQKKIREYSIKSIELNKKHDGDQACFYLYKG